jgi:CubicO group peptidase (beta-lactamase class C family)
MIRFLTVIALSGGLALTMAAADPGPIPHATPAAVGLVDARLEEATALLNRFVTERKIAGAVAAVARRGKLAYLEPVGLQDLETRMPMTDRSLFRIYSMSKPVTAVAAMMLHEDGRFHLDDPVSKYLPEFAAVQVYTSPGGTTRPPAHDMTVQDLLLHTSGLSHRTSDLYKREQVRSRAAPLPRLITNLVRVPLMEDPGTRYRYSEATSVVGRLIEIWSGKPFDVFLDEQIFRPLGMVDTSFWVRPEQRARLTSVYAPAPAGGLTPIELEEVPFTERPALLEGAVGLVSTVPDYLRFSLMLLNRGELGGVRILEEKTVLDITGNGLPGPVLSARGGGMGWGLANVNVVLNPQGLSYPANRGEYGWDGSAGTIFWIDPGMELVTVLMTQSSPANPDSLRQRFKTLIQQASPIDAGRRRP